MLKNIIGIILIITLTNCKNSNEILMDVDGNTYSTIQIGKNLWMAENLKVTKDKLGNTVNFYFPDGDSTNIRSYGLLYDFENACKVCPEGWKLPHNKDWESLFDLSNNNDARKHKDARFWKDEQSSETSLFSVRPAGIGNNQEHPNNFGTKTLFWSSDKEEEHFIWTYILEKNKGTIRKASQHPTYAFSVRCIKMLD